MSRSRKPVKKAKDRKIFSHTAKRVERRNIGVVSRGGYRL